MEGLLKVDSIDKSVHLALPPQGGRQEPFASNDRFVASPMEPCPRNAGWYALDSCTGGSHCMLLGPKMGLANHDGAATSCVSGRR